MAIQAPLLLDPPVSSATVICRCLVLLLSCPRVGEVLRVGEGPVDVGILSCLEESS
jgi:hypothetical protein